MNQSEFDKFKSLFDIRFVHTFVYKTQSKTKREFLYQKTLTVGRYLI